MDRNLPLSLSELYGNHLKLYKILPIAPVMKIQSSLTKPYIRSVALKHPPLSAPVFYSQQSKLTNPTNPFKTTSITR